MWNVLKFVPGDGIQKKSKLTAVACIGRCLIWEAFSLVLVGCQPCVVEIPSLYSLTKLSP
jgi:hypothetical protein